VHGRKESTGENKDVSQTSALWQTIRDLKDIESQDGYFLAVLRDVVPLEEIDLPFALVVVAFALGLAAFEVLVVFFEVARFAVEVFLAVEALEVLAFFAVVAAGFLTGALALVLVAAVVVAFLAGALAAGAALAVVALALGLALAVVVFLAEAFAAGLLSFLTVLIGLFSLVLLASSVLPLAANLTLPDGPLGRVKTPFSSPLMIARLIFEFTRGVISKRYFSSRYFLIVGLETPVRPSSLSTIHSEIMMMKEG